jgi:hypothetical protein
LGHEADNLIPVKNIIFRKHWMTASEISEGSKYMRHGMKKEMRIGTCIGRSQNFKSDNLVEEGTRQG